MIDEGGKKKEVKVELEKENARDMEHKGRGEVTRERKGDIEN